MVYITQHIQPAAPVETTAPRMIILQIVIYTLLWIPTDTYTMDKIPQGKLYPEYGITFKPAGSVKILREKTYILMYKEAPTASDLFQETANKNTSYYDFSLSKFEEVQRTQESVGLQDLSNIVGSLICEAIPGTKSLNILLNYKKYALNAQDLNSTFHHSLSLSKSALLSHTWGFLNMR